MENQKGFSPVDLLLVVIIIAIVAAIAIPKLLASRRAANEASAISSLRLIHNAQTTYRTTAGGNVNYSPGLDGLADHKLIDPVLATGTKSGYGIAIFGGANIYCAEATATDPSNGTRAFLVNQEGVIYTYANTASAGDCDTATGVTATPITGTAIR